MKPFRMFAPACLAVAAWMTPFAGAQVLQQVPGDALVVVKINKLKPVSEKVAAMSKKLGLADMNPDLTDPLGKIQADAGITQGVNPDGEAAFVLLNAPMEDNPPPALVLIPVSDYKAFLGNFAEPQTDGDISVVHTKNSARDTFVAQWGNYAVMAPKKEFLEKKPDGLTPQGLGAKELETKDLIAFVNMKSARTRILPAISEHRAEFVAEVEKNMQRPGVAPAQAQKFAPLARTFMNRAIDVIEQMVTDADAVTYGWSIAEDGINPTAMIDFAPGSPSATRIGQFKNTDQSLLAGLPIAKYLFVGGTSNSGSKAGLQMITDFLAPIEKEFEALGDEGKSMQSYVTSLKAYMGAITSTSFGMLAPSGMLGQDAIVQAITVSTGDAKAMIEAVKTMTDSQQAVMSLFAPQAQGSFKTTYTANAKTVDGIQLNELLTSFGAPEGQKPTPQQQQIQQMMTFMYGPGGARAYTGAVTDKIAITSTGASDAVLAKLITSAKTGDDKLAASATIQETAGKLPKQRLAAGFVALDQIVLTITNYAKAFGMPIDFQLPDNLPPIGGAISVDGSALRADGHIPAQLLQSLIAAGKQTYAEMQGSSTSQPQGPGGL